MPLALTGASAATRYVGATASGAPASGTFAVGDFCIDQSGAVFVCTAAGTPGTWKQVGASAGMVELAYAQVTADTTITATTEATANVVVTAGAVVLGGSTVVLVECFSQQVEAPAGGLSRFTAAVLYDAVDGGVAASLGSIGLIFSAIDQRIDVPFFGVIRLTPAAGSHVFSLRAYCNAGDAVVHAGAGGSGAESPCFIRVVRNAT